MHNFGRDFTSLIDLTAENSMFKILCFNFHMNNDLACSLIRIDHF